MIFYKENGISISGLKYAHLPYGPVPDKYDLLFGKMESDHIVHIDVLYDNGYEKHQVVPDCDIPQGVLSETEVTVLTRIYEKFKDFGSFDISEYSHEEKGYQSTKKGEIISYRYAKGTARSFFYIQKNILNCPKIRTTLYVKGKKV